MAPLALRYCTKHKRQTCLRTRSGWEPPRDFGLWGPSSDLLKKVLSAMSPAGREYWDAENSNEGS
eukprot:524879-Pelagomonas_calceolata.AAC.13